MDSIKKYRIKEKFDELPHGARTQAITTAFERMQINESQLRKIWGYELDILEEN